MLLPILVLALVSFVISWLATLAMKRLAPRLGFVDSPGKRKIHHTPKALGGGVAIFLGIALPLAIGLIALRNSPDVAQRYKLDLGHATKLGGGMLIALTAMHVLGLWDDKKALGPYFKLLVQLGIITGLVIGLDLRVLTFLDARLGMGAAPSIIATVLWITVITNAFNFLDNMDGLAAGVAAVCAIAFLAAALSIGQWFVCAMLALLVGAAVGFLCFNFAPASIFMGDAGSLVLGLLLGVLTVRTTYLTPEEQKSFSSYWYTVFVPVIVLAVPLYDFLVVVAIRVLHGKSPFVGDTNHFSHRLTARGMSRRTAVLCIYLVTAATSVAAVLLPHIEPPQFAPLILAQTLLILCVVALLEQHPLP